MATTGVVDGFVSTLAGRAKVWCVSKPSSGKLYLGF